jgi:hypothetical protein
MPTTVVRYQTKTDRADENHSLIAAVFEELRIHQPEGLRYTSVRLADGSFIHIVDVDEGSDDGGLTALGAFGRFAEDVSDRVLDGPDVQPAVLIGSYGHERNR